MAVCAIPLRRVAQPEDIALDAFPAVRSARRSRAFWPAAQSLHHRPNAVGERWPHHRRGHAGEHPARHPAHAATGGISEELRAWLDEHLVGEYLDFGGRGRASSDEGFDIRQRWEKELARGQWLGLSLPADYGGRGLGITEQIIFAYEYARAGAPYRLSIQGTDMLGPTLVAFGSEAQKRRFLPSILAADVIWCQGFSEPEAGSDLAGVGTRAKLQGDSWVLNGQKIWTTFGHYADWIYVLCRTDPDAPKHHGLSMLLVPIDQPGVEVRPIRNMADESDFAEVFFTDARTSADLVVGPSMAAGRWPSAPLASNGARPRSPIR